MSTRVDASGPCWLWVGKLNTYGYATTSMRGRRGLAHRLVWEALCGPIPDGMQLDHLEVVTKDENNRRGYSFSALRARSTTCALGHPLEVVDEGTGTRRRCMTCRRAQWRRAYHRAAGAA